MGRPYSLDLRTRVVSAMQAGMTGREAGKHFSIGESTALRWARRARETGSPASRPMGGKRPFALEGYRDRIKARLIFLGISTDWLFPAAEVRRFAETIRTAGANAEYREMVSDHGHDAFLAEQVELVHLLQ